MINRIFELIFLVIATNDLHAPLLVLNETNKARFFIFTSLFDEESKIIDLAVFNISIAKPLFEVLLSIALITCNKNI